MAAGEAPPKRHCPSCGSDQLLEGQVMSARIVVGEDTLLRMCISCHHSWPAMDLTNADFDLALNFADRLNGLVDCGVAAERTVVADVNIPEFERIYGRYDRYDHG